MQNKNVNPKLAALQTQLDDLEIGIAKLAAMTTVPQSKQAAGPTPELTALAETLAIKLAGIGVGTVEHAPINAAVFAADHNKALRAMTEVADHLVASSKTAEAPGSLGRPAPAATTAPAEKQRFEPRIRC